MRGAWLIVLAACGTNHAPASSDPNSCDHAQTGSTCCESNGDCANGASCSPPGFPSFCGACDITPGDCTTDAQCTGTDICEPINCSCNGLSKCVAGCADDTSCDPGNTCDVSTHRCAPTMCLHASECPTDFICNTTCQRRPCSSDAQCDGYCVTGSCFERSGECRLPVP